MQKISTQTGWTFWSLSLVLAVVIFFAYIGMRLVPVYAANANIKNAMEISLQDVNLSTVNRATIIRKMNTQLYLDGIQDVLDTRKNIKVKRSRNAFVLEAIYQRKVPLFFNLSLTADFENKIERELNAN